MSELEGKKVNYLLSKKQLWSRIILSRENRAKRAKSKRESTEEKIDLIKNGEDVYWEIEDIQNQREICEGKQEVYIKWKGWPNEFNSWEPVENLNSDLPTILKNIQWEKKKSKRKKRFEGMKSIKEMFKKDREKKRVSCVMSPQSRIDYTEIWPSKEQITNRDLVATQLNISTINREETKELERTPIPISKDHPYKSSYIECAGTQSTNLSPIGESQMYSDINHNNQTIELSMNQIVLSENNEQQSMQASLVNNNHLMPVMQNEQSHSEQLEKAMSERLSEQQMQYEKNSCASDELLTHSIDRILFSYKINGHNQASSGKFVSFQVNAIRKYEISEAPISFWCSIQNSKSLFEKELLDYMFQLYRRKQLSRMQ